MSPSMQGNMLSSLAMTMPSALMSLGSNGSASSTTYAAVSEGSLLIRDTANQQQDVTTLSHDVEHANNALSPIFNKEKEQQRLRQAQLIGEIGGQVMDIVRTEGEQRALKKAEESGEVGYPRPADDANDQDIDKKWAAYKAALTQTQSYKDEMKQYGVGSSYQQAAQAATAAIQALAGGDIKQAIAGGAAPYLAQLVKEATLPAKGEPTTEQRAANLMGHAIVGAVVAQLSGKDAGAGALGAASGELAAEVIRQKMFDGRDVKDLSESEKQSLSALSTLAAGLASGLASGNTADGASGAQAGRNAVENNYLNSTQALMFDKELSDCRKAGGDCQAVIDKWKKINDGQSATVDERLENDPLTAVGWDKEVAQGGYDMTERPSWLSRIGADVMTNEEAKAYVQQWNGQDLANIDVNSSGWTEFVIFISAPENQAVVASLGMLGKDLILVAKNTFTTKSLLKEMTAQGIKFTHENVVGVAKDSSGKIIFLEKGNSKSGLQHIVEEHGSQFAQIGVPESRIPDVVLKAAAGGKIVGYQGSGTGRPIYETMINGKKYNIAVTVGNNGYIVGANLRGSVK